MARVCNLTRQREATVFFFRKIPDRNSARRSLAFQSPLYERGRQIAPRNLIYARVQLCHFWRSAERMPPPPARVAKTCFSHYIPFPRLSCTDGLGFLDKWIHVIISEQRNSSGDWQTAHARVPKNPVRRMQANWCTSKYPRERNGVSGTHSPPP